MQARVFFFFAGGSGILNSNWHVSHWKEEAVLCKIHMCSSKSPLTRVLNLLHLASLCIWQGCVLAACSTVFQSFCSV